ncbi:hypothetical protein BX616_004191 [Lobosporangium transversale]|uniref:Uncharacterized protein n=1 Tax=Lobosporangium transversale TaxID=64571 RepID=A0A1Y2GM84_9FUNG|nr:hypothetical protein BCR41DRAFT_355439 [Lobosporangium transversale]KAF9918919.1 hypothetical protein BX616_004191 [Lobosporangium transversale]ORZ13323.1 hypothetical protein BCR41DRAFT_355439 [Lobosporangium transversale]|eukprot:XP_021880404.1 hypothetical protein BCR41DRAFT_355439 [Lobosporangium transversale]
MLSTQPRSFDVLGSFKGLSLDSSTSHVNNDSDNNNSTSDGAFRSTTSTRSKILPKAFTRVAKLQPNNSTSLFDNKQIKTTESNCTARRDSGHCEDANDSTNAYQISKGLQRFRPSLPSFNSQDSDYLALPAQRDSKKITCSYSTFTRIPKLPSNNSNNTIIHTGSPCNSSSSSNFGSNTNNGYHHILSSCDTKSNHNKNSFGRAASALSLSLSLSPPPSTVPPLSSASSCSSASTCSPSASSPPTRFVFPTNANCKNWWFDTALVETPPQLEERFNFDGNLSSGSYRLPTSTDIRPFDSLDHYPTPSCLTDGRSQYSSINQHIPTTSPSLPESKGPCTLEFQGQQQQQIKRREKEEEGEESRHHSLPQTSHQGFQQIKPNTNTNTSTTQAHFLNRPRNPSPPPVLTGFCSLSKNTIKSSGEPSPQDYLGETDLPYPMPSTLQERQARQRKRAEQLRQLKIREEREARENIINHIKNSSGGRTYGSRRSTLRVGLGMRRRGASFSAGMYGIYPHSYSCTGTGTSFTPGSPSLSRPLSMSLSSWMSGHDDQNTLYHFDHRQHALLKRSPSSPVRSINCFNDNSINNIRSNDNSNNNEHNENNESSCNKPKPKNKSNGDIPRKPRICVGFDLQRTKVFEYEVGEAWTPCSNSAPPSPTAVHSAEGAQGYFSLYR